MKALADEGMKGPLVLRTLEEGLNQVSSPRHEIEDAGLEERNHGSGVKGWVAKRWRRRCFFSTIHPLMKHRRPVSCDGVSLTPTNFGRLQQRQAPTSKRLVLPNEDESWLSRE